METIQFLLTFTTGFSFGVLLSFLSNKFYVKYKNIKRLKDINEKYKEILDNIENGNSKFKTRVNSIIYISMKLKNLGRVDIVYSLDSKEIYIFKKTKCLYVCNEVNKELINKISNKIEYTFKNEINDIINFMGVFVSKKDVEKSLNISIDNIMKQSMDMFNTIKKPKSTKKPILKVDDILDKINKNGIENLSEDEINFLNNLNKK